MQFPAHKNGTHNDTDNLSTGAVIVPWTTGVREVNSTSTLNAPTWLRSVVAVLDKGPWDTDPQMALKVAVASPLACVMLCAVCAVCHLCHKRRRGSSSSRKRSSWPDSAVEAQLDDIESTDEDDYNDGRHTPPYTDDEQQSAVAHVPTVESYEKGADTDGGDSGENPLSPSLSPSEARALCTGK